MDLHDLDSQIQAVVSRIDLAALPDDIAPAALTPAQLARLIDHTVLKPETGEEQVRQLCAEALHYEFASVCVNPLWVPLCAELLAGSPVKACCVAGFPLGASLPAVTVFEVHEVAALGAREIDMVIPVGLVRDGNHRLVANTIADVADAAHEHNLPLKVILETGLLTDEQKIAACVICQLAGADFVKTATGFSGGGATVRDVALMRQVVGPAMGVKAAGGVRSAVDALRVVAAGANRIGTSSGVKIMQELAGSQVEGSPARDEGY
jgi:deoxyribose-phosphate aldolase